MGVRLELDLKDHTDSVAARLADWGRADLLQRVWDKDHTIWSEELVPELTNRLGWLDLPERLAGLIPALEGLGAELANEGIADLVVLGMGGSSLAPEVFVETFGSAPGAPRLQVLDSTHPAAVETVAASIELERTVFIVASKSGTTIEPLSFMEYFWQAVGAITDDPGRHFVATTDPGSKLEALAVERSFRAVFLAQPEVGGRFSALTEFGMVPAAAIGADLQAMQSSAVAQQSAHSPSAMVASAPGCRLGAAMGELALAGRDKITFVTSLDLQALPAWIEQLIAESTGKDDTGIVPVGGEPLGDPSVYGHDRFFVAIQTAGAPPIDLRELAEHPSATMTLDTVDDIAGAMYILEIATALAGAVLGIQPFDQPDVQLAKELARDAMAGSLDMSEVVELDAMAPDLADAVSDWIDSAQPGDYVGIQAFIAPTAETEAILTAARLAVRDFKSLATTLDFGPRFLHSTGQLHKGGPNTGLFLEIIDHPAPDLQVPTTDYSFAELVSAQSLGDHLALRRRRRRVLLVSLADNGLTALQRVADLVVAAVE